MPAVCSKRLYRCGDGDRSHRASQARAGSVLGRLELAAYLPPMPRTEDGHGEPRPLHDAGAGRVAGASDGDRQPGVEKTEIGGIHLTGLAVTCRAWVTRVLAYTIQDRWASSRPGSRLPGLCGLVAVARRLRLSDVWSRGGLASRRWPVQVLGVQYAQFGDRGYDL